MRTAKDSILRGIRDLRRGAVFTPKDFLDVANRGTVDMTLHGLVERGIVTRLARGLYHYPKQSAFLKGPLSPELDAVAQALARRFRWHIVPSGAHAANLLGLSTQVPAKAVYLSDGPSKIVSVGKRQIVFKHARPKDLAPAGEHLSAVVIQALRYLGRDAVGSETIADLKKKLPKPARTHLLHDARFGTDWIYAAARAIAESD